MNPNTVESMTKEDPVGISTAVCTHMPEEPFRYVGQHCKCKLCGVELVCNNNPPGTKKRMSKKVRRVLKKGAIN